MATAAEARGHWRPLNEELQTEEVALNEELQTEEGAHLTPEQLRKAIAVIDVRDDTKFSLRTGNKLSPLMVRSSGQFGTEEINKNASGPWNSPPTTPPTKVKF